MMSAENDENSSQIQIESPDPPIKKAIGINNWREGPSIEVLQLED